MYVKIIKKEVKQVKRQSFEMFIKKLQHKFPLQTPARVNALKLEFHTVCLIEISNRIFPHIMCIVNIIDDTHICTYILYIGYFHTVCINIWGAQFSVDGDRLEPVTFSSSRFIKFKILQTGTSLLGFVSLARSLAGKPVCRQSYINILWGFQEPPGYLESLTFCWSSYPHPFC